MALPITLIIIGYFQTYIVPLITRFIRLFVQDARNKLPPINNRIIQLNANEIVAEIRAGKLTCYQVVEAYHERIKLINPIINAVVEFDDRAYQVASEMDEKIRLERENGVDAIGGQSILSKPMLGVPFTAKNSVCVEGILNHVGVVARKDVRAEKTANCVKNLMNAGAIFIASTNTPEFSMDWDTCNNVAGRTNNPHDLSRSPGGSSGGEGALIASAGSLIGVGSDIGGSIRIPAFINGIYGLKPSQDLVKCNEHYPPPLKCYKDILSFGPMCRYSSDIKLAFKCMMDDEVVAKVELEKPTDFKKMRIFYIENAETFENTENVDHTILSAIKKAAFYFNKTYGTEVRPLPQEYLDMFNPVIIRWFHAMSDSDDFIPASIQLNGSRYFINPPLELIKIFLGRSCHTIQTILYSMLQKSLGGSNDQLRKEMEEIKLKYRQLLGSDGLIFMPTLPVPARKWRETPIHTNDCYLAMPGNLLGLPTIGRPSGRSDNGLPIGFQIIGTHLSDGTLINVACELDKVFDGYVSPCPVSS